MQKIDRTNEQRQMKNGFMATIIRYGNSHDINIEFDDGAVVEHRAYNNFLRGDIKHPQGKACKGHFDHKKSRIGETRAMNTGDVCTIIKYNSSHDITVQFENGHILYNRYYRDFVHGQIKDAPEYGSDAGEIAINKPGTSKKETLKMFREGMKQLQKYGLIGEIIKYRTASDMDVRFSDGGILEHVRYDKFKNSLLISPLDEHAKSYLPQKDAKETRIGEKRMMSCGLYAKILEYRSSLDMDIIFEDGMITHNVVYDAFKKGNVAHPAIKLHAANIKYGEYVIIKHAYSLKGNKAFFVVRNMKTGKKNIMSSEELVAAYLESLTPIPQEQTPNN